MFIFVEGLMYNISAITKSRYIHGAALAKIWYKLYFSVHHAPRTPPDWLGGSVLDLLLLSYTHIIHAYIYDHMHQVVAGSGWNTSLSI